jgi:hypothetical protein
MLLNRDRLGSSSTKNLLLHSQGPTLILKIADFGLAKSSAEVLDDIAGTPLYMVWKIWTFELPTNILTQ